MDYSAILAGLKDKMLDLKHIEILRHAFNLQNETIQQLKTSNETFRDRNDFLKEQVTTLQGEVKMLQGKIETLQKSLPTESEYHPQGFALRIMLLYKDAGKTECYEGEMHRKLQCSDIELSVALRELSDNHILRCSSFQRESSRRQGMASDTSGGCYKLTADGEKLVLRL
jgi:FtsZ-binding cell division protein ZapB